jgi:hypothetical protein
VRLLLTALVFAADLWALLQIFDAEMTRRQRWKWIALVTGVPVVGVMLWIRRRSLPR